MSKLPLPKESESQEIGHLAVKAFQTQTPESWRPTDLSGDSDVGLDMLVQVVSAGRYAFAFHAQIKGSAVDRSNVGREYFSIPLKVATVNYLRRVSTPVMLVFADLSTGRRSQSPLYYSWIHEELQTVVAGMNLPVSDDAEVTFRVPVGKVLDQKLDVAPYLSRWNDEHQSLDGLQNAIVGVSGEATTLDVVQRLADNVRRGGACFVDSIQFASDQPWPDPQPGSIGWRLKQLSDSIVDGDIQAARDLIQDLSTEDLTDDAIARAELEYQNGRLQARTGDPASAKQHYSVASKLQPQNPRYLCAKHEIDLQTSSFRSAATATYDELTLSPLADENRVKALRARCLLLQDRFPEAFGLLDGIPDRYALVERALGKYLQGLPEQVAEISDSADVSIHSRSTLLTLRILALRARFETLFNRDLESFIPAAGPPGVDPADIQKVWEEVQRLAVDLRLHAWPQNSQVLIDVLVTCGLAVGRAAEALVLLDDFLVAHPHLLELQAARMKVAVLAERYDIAADAASRLPTASARAVNEVLVHYEMQDYDGVCKRIPVLLRVSDPAEEFFRDALAIAAHAARSTFNFKLADECLRHLTSFPDSGPTIAVYEFVVAASSGDKRETEAAVERLKVAYEKWPASKSIQDQLFQALRSGNANSALLATKVAERIGERRQLFGHEVTHLAMRLRELGRLDDAVLLLEKSRIRIPTDPEIPALLALVLERKGEAGRALAVLETLLAEHRDAPEMARSILINIASRNGLIDAAAAQFQALLASRPSKDDRREIYRALFSLEMHRKADADRAVALAYQYGSLVDQTDEFQEGLFLQMVTMCGTLPGCSFTPAQQSESHQRCEAFLSAFPNSKYFSALNLPVDMESQDFLRALREKAGLTDEYLKGIQKLANGLERGTLPIPYALRPRRVLINVGSVPHLWEITKRTKLPAAAYHLLMHKQRQDPRDMRSLRGLPFIDLTTLLLASDLGILDLLFEIYGRIAVSKSTLLRIQQEAGYLGLQTESLLKLRAALTARMDRIVQPGSMEDEDAHGKPNDVEDFRRLAAKSDFVAYTDDVCLRILTLGDDNFVEGLTTPDVIESAERAQLLTVQEAARHYATLAGWNIGHVSIQYRHFLAAIPSSVHDLSNVTSKVEVLFGDPVFRSLADAVWDHDKPYDDVLNHAAAVIAKILNDSPVADERLIAALLSIWLDKVVLRPKPSLSRENHLAALFILAFMQLEAPEPAPQHLWAAYRHAIERIHGERMDEAKERDAIELVGRLVATVPNKNPDLGISTGDLVEKLRTGLVSGTADDKYLLHGYHTTRAESALRAKRE